MKTIALLLILALTSCTTLVTKVTAPDGTVTETTATNPDSATVSAVAQATAAIAPSIIRASK